jgi:hypothetical protein
MKIAADPAALESTAGLLVTLAYDVGTVPRGLSGEAAACAQACGDAGLGEGVHTFAARIDGGVSDLSRAVDLLGQVLVAVAGAYRETDTSAVPTAPGG